MDEWGIRTPQILLMCTGGCCLRLYLECSAFEDVEQDRSLVPEPMGRRPLEHAST